MKKKSLSHFLIPIAALFILTPWGSSAIALVLGVFLAVTFGNPYSDKTRKITQHGLSLAVMGLGFGMNLGVIAKVGMQGIGYTVVGIVFVFLIGSFLGKLLQTDRDTSLLITVGTAICGGSAIAAVSPVIRAKSHDISVSLGTVFMLNALALLIFPSIGHSLNLSEHQFGLWSALAIHDTSSVVGATLQYGPQALEVGTTVKLARALWIIPVAMMIGLYRSRTEIENREQKQKAKRPWFILGFILAAAIVTWVPSLVPIGQFIEGLARKLMVLTLFFIGTNITRETLRSVGIKPFLQGISLWFIMATATLLGITMGVIS